jgi:predicted kinase
MWRIRDYADDFYDNGGYGMGPDYSGMLILLDMNNRAIWLSTGGVMIEYINDMREEAILDRAYDHLSYGGYASGVQAALERVEYCRALAEEQECLHAPYPFADPYSARAYFREQTHHPSEVLYRASFGEVILMAGLPGTGKDTYIAKHYPDLPVVSLDAIRARLGIKPTDAQAPVVAAAREEAREHLRKKQPFVWNATSTVAQLRRDLISLFEGYGASVRTVFLETSLATELARNKGRDAVVPEPVIHKMLSRLEIPERYESETVEWHLT